MVLFQFPSFLTIATYHAIFFGMAVWHSFIPGILLPTTSLRYSLYFFYLYWAVSWSCNWGHNSGWLLNWFRWLNSFFLPVRFNQGSFRWHLFFVVKNVIDSIVSITKRQHIRLNLACSSPFVLVIYCYSDVYSFKESHEQTPM